MAVTITATVGSASANSYATLAEAETYMEARLNGTLWDASTDDNKNRALVEAARELDPLGWDGYRVDDTQAMSWPRSWVVNPDDPNRDYYGSTTVPQRVKDAQCELAFQFIKSGVTDVAAQDPYDYITEKKIDVLVTKYAPPGSRPRGLARYPRVMKLIRPLLVASSGISRPLVRG
jgi:hypothetical protein